MDGVESAVASASADLAACADLTVNADLTVRGLLSAIRAYLALELLSVCVLPNRVQVAAQLPFCHLHCEPRADLEVWTLVYLGHAVSENTLR